MLVEDRYQRESYGMLFETNPVDLRELIAKAKSGLIQLPDFQRGWVWDDERIAALLVTVARGYPLGVMMAMETGNPDLEFRSKPLVGTSPPEGTQPEQLLMDGQQRLTSLSQALASEHAVETMDSRRKRLQRYYYIDIRAAAYNPEQMENAIFSVPEDKKLPRIDEHGKRTAIDLTTQANEIAAGMFPLRMVYGPGKATGGAPTSSSIPRPGTTSRTGSSPRLTDTRCLSSDLLGVPPRKLSARSSRTSTRVGSR